MSHFDISELKSSVVLNTVQVSIVKTEKIKNHVCEEERKRNRNVLVDKIK